MFCRLLHDPTHSEHFVGYLNKGAYEPEPGNHKNKLDAN
jgi:hypothetical protein